MHLRRRGRSFAVMNPLQTPTLAGPTLRGEVVRPGDASYEELRRVPNAMIDRRPALIALVADADDVAAAIAYARANDLAIGVRGGGHSGMGVVDGGLVIDVRSLDRIVVDPLSRAVRVGAGALVGAVDAALAEHGLALTGGRVTDVGMTGFTLGSGSGWLERVMGLASDNLRSATLVTADGRVVSASLTEHPDLFWALRGGGGNFGVVTELEFRTMALGPMVVGGIRVYPIDVAREVLATYADVMASAPDELCGGIALRCAPPAPFVPEQLVGEPIVMLVALWAGDIGDAAQGLASLDALGTPAVDLVGPMPYVELQKLMGPPPGAPPMRGYVKFGFLDELDATQIELLDGLTGELCTKSSAIVLQPMGGAVARAGDTALGARDAAWAYQLLTTWADSGDDAPNIAWTRAAAAELNDHGRPAPWPNFVPEGDPRRLAVPYAPETLARLREIKTHWDPENLFRSNHNIRPI